MGLLLVTGPFLLPESRNPQAGKLDLISVALSRVISATRNSPTLSPTDTFLPLIMAEGRVEL